MFGYDDNSFNDVINYILTEKIGEREACHTGP